MEGWGLNKVMHFAQGATPMCKATQSRGTSGGTMVTVNATVLTTILSLFICPQAHTVGRGGGTGVTSQTILPITDLCRPFLRHPKNQNNRINLQRHGEEGCRGSWSNIQNS